MNDMIIISRSPDREFSENIEKLHLIIPSYIAETEGEEEDVSHTNPFMDYILEKDSIRRDLYDFLYHSDFLQDITEKSLLAARELYDRNANIGWFNMLQSVFDEKRDVDDYCDVIMECFRNRVSIEDARVMFEVNGSAAEMKNNLMTFLEIHGEYKGVAEEASKEVDVSGAEREKYEQLLSQQNEFIETLQKKNTELNERNGEYFNNLEKAYDSVRELKREMLQIRLEKERSERFALDNERIAKSNGSILSGYVARIRALEEKIVTVSDELSEAQASLEEQRLSLEEKTGEIERLRDESARNADLADQYHEQLMDLASKQVSVTVDERSDKEDSVTEYAPGQAADAALYDDPSILETKTDNVGKMESYDNGSDGAYPEEEEQFIYPDMQPDSDKTESLKKKGGWFMDFLFRHSEKFFNARPRQEQENLINFKMMDMQFSVDMVRYVKTNMNDAVPCFDLYKLISRNPTEDDLEMFFSDYGLNAAMT